MRRVIAAIVLLGLSAVSAAPQDKQLRKPELSNTIDRILEGKWSGLKGGPAPVAEDGEFLRRLSLDLRGHPPGAAEVREFLADQDANKRLAKIDEYLASDAYAAQMGHWLNNVLFFENCNNLYIQPGKNFNGKTKRRLEADFRKYLKAQAAKDTSLIVMLKELLETSGSTENNPLVLYKLSMYDGEPSHLEFADKVSRSWLGVKISCARCHDHPFDQWTQEDFYGLAGFFTRHKLKLLGGDKNDNCDEVEMYEDANATPLTMPETGKVLKARFVYGGDAAKADPYMTALAIFMSRRDHNQLARNFANRVWAWLMGRGLVHPVDDFNKKNRPTIPELLDNLARDLAANKYSLKHLTRAICASRAYQRASAREVTGDVKDHARATIRQMTTTQLFNSLVMAARGPEVVAKGDQGMWNYWAGQMNLVFGPGIPWSEISFVPGNARAMLLIRNSDQIRNLLRPLAQNACTAPGPVAEKIDNLFLTILCRLPADAERERWTRWLASNEGYEGYDDMVWTLVNSTEFVTRH